MGVAVLASGRGSNLAALLRACRDPAYPAEVVAVAGNRASAPALALGREAGLPCRSFPQRQYQDAVTRDRALADWLISRGATLLVLAGYDRVLTPELLERFPGRVLNLHNSLLPAFSGTMHAVEEALDHGVKVTGCTVHLVTPEQVDGGPIVLQAAVEVQDGDDPASLLQRIHEQEWRILPEAVALVASGSIRLEGRRVLRSGR